MTSRDSTRTRELAMIHVAKKQLGLDDETYRAMLWTVARVRSSAALDFAGRKNVLDHMKARGFKSAPGKRGREGRPHNMEGSERSPQLKKVEALLADAGRPWSYADGIAKRMFQVDRVAFCDGAQLQAIIAAMIYDQGRRVARAASDASHAN